MRNASGVGYLIEIDRLLLSPAEIILLTEVTDDGLGTLSLTDNNVLLQISVNPEVKRILKKLIEEVD